MRRPEQSKSMKARAAAIRTAARFLNVTPTEFRTYARENPGAFDETMRLIIERNRLTDDIWHREARQKA